MHFKHPHKLYIQKRARINVGDAERLARNEQENLRFIKLMFGFSKPTTVRLQTFKNIPGLFSLGI